MRKVWMYVDGPNFYYSMSNTGTNIALGWCDFRKLAEQYLLDKDSTLDRIDYFTAPVKDLGHHDGEERRQNTWLDAVRTIPGLYITKGFYAGSEPSNRKEKQTDVSIAVKLILDAIKGDGYDTAILVSGDTDLAPAVQAVQKEIPGGKSVQVCVPLSEPAFYWTELSGVEGFVVKTITADMLQNSRLPESIRLKREIINCPERWKLK